MSPLLATSHARGRFENHTPPSKLADPPLDNPIPLPHLFTTMTRRTALTTIASTAAASLAATAGAQVAGAAKSAESLYKVQKGRIKQSVIHWCFNPMSVEELAKHSVALGIQSVELVDPKEWPMLKQLGLTCAIAGSHGFSKGFAHREEWAECHKALRGRIEQCAAAGIGRVITFSGFRRGLSDEEGSKNMVAGLKEIAGFAEEKKVTICLEMLNSRVDIQMKGHPDYFCDSMERSIEILKQVGSPRCKVLFDIYHVQIMHGDVISRIKQYKEYLGHIHTAGVPGRAEIDETQELNYPPIMQALLDVGYDGYVGQEFIPVRTDKVASLAQGVRICDV
jgi:hydroxypyruvate isomerase